jgi:hypothetical protein
MYFLVKQGILAGKIGDRHRIGTAVAVMQQVGERKCCIQSTELVSNIAEELETTLSVDELDRKTVRTIRRRKLLVIYDALHKEPVAWIRRERKRTWTGYPV